MIEKISSWGRLDSSWHDVCELLSSEHAIHTIPREQHQGIAHGLGRSYGDIALNPKGLIWKTSALNRYIAWDPATGKLTCEAGVSLYEIQQFMIPRGWTLPVTPGTQWVTVGGAIANDVHGKNHHVYGSFGHHVSRLTVLRTDGELISCDPIHRSDFFSATIGGAGLTGIILEAELQLRRIPGAWFHVETIGYDSLENFFLLADASEKNWEQTVAWMDCVGSDKGRGYFMRANWSAHPTKSSFSIPLRSSWTMPRIPLASLLLKNRWSLIALNYCYYHLKIRDASMQYQYKYKYKYKYMDYVNFLYPLDHIIKWNRLYGTNGFYQYQSVVPRSVGYDAVKAMLRETSRAGLGSCLAVLKTFGRKDSLGMLSFPRPGVTLALDFPNQGHKTHRLFERLDAIVREANGCLYLAKDARMPRDLFEKGYPRLSEFLSYRDPGISSALSRRLIGK